MDLSIIIVSWNVKDKLGDNLAAIFKTNGFEYEVFVIDNNSQDDTVEMIKKEYPQVKLLENKENLGFAKATNQGIKYATGRFILFLNPDMRVFPDTLANMIGWMDNHPEAAIAGCRLVDENGRVIKQIRCFPTFKDQLAITLKLPHLFPGVLKYYLREDFDYTSEAEVDSLRGAFMMMRADTTEKIGQLDEQFFLWFEDVDYCRRAREAGLKVMFTPEAECLDFVGQSFGQIKRGKTQKYFRDSMLKYFKKWHPDWQYWILKLAWPWGRFMAIAGSLAGIKNKAKT